MKNQEQKKSNMMPDGMTKRQRKRIKGSSTPGRDKGENCHATGLDKAMAKYPRSYKSFPMDYQAFIEKKQQYQR